MSKVHLFFIGMLFNVFIMNAYAQQQNCPYCVPGTNVPVEVHEQIIQQQNQTQQKITEPTMRFHDYYPPIRWGAYAQGERVYFQDPNPREPMELNLTGVGFSSGFETREEAERAAVKVCREGGGENCALVVSYGNACFEFAMDKKTGIYSWNINNWRIDGMTTMTCTGPDGTKVKCYRRYTSCKLGEKFPRTKRIL